MNEVIDSEVSEELPRCEVTPRLSCRLEERLELLKSADDSSNKLTIIINIKDGKVLGADAKNADAVISSRHPNLFAYLNDNKIPYKFLKGSGQVVAEINYSQFTELKGINHGEIKSLDKSCYSMKDYLGVC